MLLMIGLMRRSSLRPSARHRPAGRAVGANNNPGRSLFPWPDGKNKCSFATNNETANG